MSPQMIVLLLCVAIALTVWSITFISRMPFSSEATILIGADVVLCLGLIIALRVQFAA